MAEDNQKAPAAEEVAVWLVSISAIRKTAEGQPSPLPVKLREMAWLNGSPISCLEVGRRVVEALRDLNAAEAEVMAAKGRDA
ncbi:MAG: hypothetical protein INF92_12555 [Rhodobacter sp.]|nr:hypothetical protein [Rhodobacter sp.]